MKRESSILCNPAELREVFINIINNSLDAMPEGGSLSFSTWIRDGMTVDFIPRKPFQLSEIAGLN